MKKYIMFVLFTITFALTLPYTTKALDYNGDGRYQSVQGTTECKLTWWDACPTNIIMHTTVKATIAYVEDGIIKKTYKSKCYTKYLSPSADTRLGKEAKEYAQDLVDGYLSNCIEADFSPNIDLSKLKSGQYYSMYTFDSNTIEKYFKDNNDKNFYILFDNAKVKNEEDLKKWMKNECNNLGKGVDCHGDTGENKGFRVLIEPMYTVVQPKDGETKRNNNTTDYNKETTLITMKQLLLKRSWSNSTRGLRYPSHLYTVKNDVGIEAPLTSEINEYKKSIYDDPLGTSALNAYNTDFKAKVISQGYSLNIISWPVNEIVQCGYDKYGHGVCPDGFPNCNLSECPNKECQCEYDEQNKPMCPEDCLDCNISKCPITNDSCNYSIEKSIPTSCDSFTSGYVTDSASWSCIFKSKSSSKEEIKNHYIETTSTYCSVYCREKVTSGFPNYGVTVEQGKYMVINDSSYGANINPLQYKGEKECRITSTLEGILDKNQLNNNLLTQNPIVKEKWDKYQQSIATYNAYANSSYSHTIVDNKACRVSWRQDNEEREKCDIRVKNEKEENQNDIDNIEAEKERYEDGLDDLYDALSFAKSMPKKTKKQEEERNSAIETINTAISDAQTLINQSRDILNNLRNKTFDDCSSDSVVPYDVCDNYPNKEWWSAASGYSLPDFSDYQSGGWEYEIIYSKYDDNRKNFSSKKLEEQNKMNAKKAEYEKQMTIRDNMIEAFQSCTTKISDNIIYKFQPQLKMEYEESIYGGQEIELTSSLYENTEKKYFHNGNATNGSGTEVTNYWDEIAETTNCVTGNHCTDDVELYKYSTWWKVTKTKLYEYKLPSSLYKYIEKSSGQSVNTTLAGFQYYTVPVGNLPVHFSTLPGMYDYNIKTINYNNKFDDYIFSSKRFNNKSYYNSSEQLYGCQYNVSCNNIIQNTSCGEYNSLCPGVSNNINCKGLNVVYRTISLNSEKEAFPGIDGTGRKPGKNWANSSTVYSYILNNRGKKGYEIYSLDPLYEIELTPTIMRIFREYNKTMNSKKITIYTGTGLEKEGIAGYSDFSNIKCSSGTHCVSDLLRGKVSLNGTDKITVTGCGIINSGYTNCGNSKAW